MVVIKLYKAMPFEKLYKVSWHVAKTVKICVFC